MTKDTGDDKVTPINSRRKTNATAKVSKQVENIREGKTPEGKPKPAPKKKGRTVALGLRTVKVNNFNFAPEKAGDKLVERADLSLEILLEEKDIDDVVSCRRNPLETLWDKNGEPNLRELEGGLPLDLRVEGKATFNLLNRDKDEALEFEGAVLKKVRIEPMIGFKATLRCQVRVDPTGNMEELAALRIAEKCSFSFRGTGASEDPETQGQLNV